MYEKDNSARIPPRRLLATDDAPQGAPSQATLLSLPREFRNQIYEDILPFASILVDVEKGCLTGSPCLHARTYYDTTAEWIEDGAIVGRSKACSHGRWNNPAAKWKEVEWPFGLLFACRKTYEEWSEELYRRNQFTFHTSTAMVKFVIKTPPKHVALIKDLRLVLPIGPVAGIFHENNFVEVCRAFSGVRRLDVTLLLRFGTKRCSDEAIETQWKMDHWTRALLNFAHLPLDHATVVMCDGNRLYSMDRKKLQSCAEAMRLQLLADWDRQAVVAALQARYTEEVEYHKTTLSTDLFSLGLPEEGVP